MAFYLATVMVLSHAIFIDSAQVRLFDAITKNNFNRPQYHCENEQLNIACSELNSEGARSGRPCSCDRLQQSHRSVVIKVNGREIHSCPVSNGKGCSFYQHTFKKRGRAVIRCELKEGNRVLKYKSQNFITTCGPKRYKYPLEKRGVKSTDEQTLQVFCPIPEGTQDDFDYSWYYQAKTKDNFVGSGRLLRDDINLLPVSYFCVVRNRLSNRTATFALYLYKDNSEENVSILWVVIPAILIMVTIPLLYIAYLKFVGELDICDVCRVKLFEDGQVDYMVTQTGGSIPGDKKMAVPKIKKSRKLFRKTMKRVSAAIDRIGSSVTVSATVAVSLPMTETKAKIAESKRYRGRRAKLLNSLDIAPLFRRQPREIKLQNTKPYENDPDSAWLIQGIKKVERWQVRHRNIHAVENSSDIIEPTIDIGKGIEKYEKKFLNAAEQLTFSNVPCNNKEWLETHRMVGPNVVLHPTDKFGFEDEISEMAGKLMNIYLEAKPYKTYFPTVRRIVDPFQSILTDPQHPSHEKTKENWEEFMDKLFIIAGDVGTFNKLCRRILERVLNTHGNPEKIKITDPDTNK